MPAIYSVLDSNLNYNINVDSPQSALLKQIQQRNIFSITNFMRVFLRNNIVRQQKESQELSCSVFYNVRHAQVAVSFQIHIF